jgi:hypothetical protein
MGSAVTRESHLPRRVGVRISVVPPGLAPFSHVSPALKALGYYRAAPPGRFRSGSFHLFAQNSVLARTLRVDSWYFIPPR